VIKMSTKTEFEAFETLDLAPIKTKLMHVESGEGWSELRANAVEAEYRRFLFLMKKYPESQASPTVDVDTFWHYHILDTMKYARDCEAVFGYFLHHYPYVGIGEGAEEGEQEAAGERMRALYEAEFGASAAGDAAWCAAPGKSLAEGGEAAWCASPGSKAAWCASPGSKAAWCASPGVKAAWCASPGKALAEGGETAWCASPGSKAAWCAAPGKSASEGGKSAWCASPGSKAAWCASPGKAVAEGAKTAWCASPGKTMSEAVKTAWCASPGKSAQGGNDTAWCAVPGKSAQSAWCASPGKSLLAA
jgi:hypothetical protein